MLLLSQGRFEFVIGDLLYFRVLNAYHVPGLGIDERNYPTRQLVQSIRVVDGLEVDFPNRYKKNTEEIPPPFPLPEV